MAISVKDIQEKEFSTQANGGYNIDEVDDFLDAVAEQLGALVRENLALNGTIKKLNADLEAKDAEVKEAQSKLPDYKIDSYFKNMEAAMRESLISAQRIADETKATAKVEADDTLADAIAKADDVTAKAQKQVEEAKAELETLKAAAGDYREKFRKLVEDQLSVLKANDLLLK